MKTTIPSALKMLILVALFLQYNAVFAQPPLCVDFCAPNFFCGSLAVSGGLCPGSPSEFCEGDTICVENNSITNTFDEWVVWWSDGTCDSYPNTTTSAFHIYNIDEDTCLININALNWPITIKNIKYCGPGAGEYSLNCVTTWIKIKVNPVAIYVKPQTVCKGVETCFFNTSCANADTAYYKWYVDGALVSETFNLCYIFPAGGSYDVCLEARNECGSNTSCHSIAVIDIPIAQSDFSYESDACLPAEVLLLDESIGPASITWAVLNGIDGINYQFISNDDLDRPDTTLQLVTPDTFELIHIATNVCGADTSYLTIQAFDIPEVSLATSPSFCGSVLFAPDVTYNGSIDTVNWVVDNGPDTIPGFFPQILLEAGSHTIQVIVNGPCGIDTDVVSVQVNPADSIAFNPIEVLCVGSDPVPLEVFFLSNGQAVPLTSGTFSCINNDFIQNGFFDPTMAGVGLHTICFSASNGLCPDSASIDIMVAQGADVQVGGLVELCSDADPYTISFSPAGGTWTGDGITDPVNGIFDPAVAGGGTGGDFDLEYRYDDPSGCVTYKTKVITVVELPLLIAGDISICQADMVFDAADLSGLNFTSSDANLTCFINGMAGCFFNPDTMDMGMGSIDVLFTYTLFPGCSTSEQVSLEITELIEVQAPQDTSVCGGETLTLSAAPGNCAIWSPSPYISPGGVVNTDAFQGAQIFTVTCNPGTVCETSDEVTVTVIGQGAAVFLSEDWVCRDQASYILPQGNPSDGVWSGDFLNGNVIDVSAFPASGVYSYDYTVSYLPDACETATFVLNVGAVPLANFTNPAIGCTDIGVTFTNTSIGATHFFWDFGNGLFSNLINPTSVYENTGDYTITLTAWTEHPLTLDTLCANTFTNTIHISQPPQNVEIGAGILVGCGPLELDFSNLSLGENMNYQWYFVNIDTLDEEDPGSIVFEQIGTDTTFYEVILQGWNDCGILYDTIQVAVLPDPTAAFGIQFDEPCSGGEVILNNLSLGHPLNHTWTVTNLTLNTTTIFNAPNPLPFLVFAPDTAVAIVIIQLETSNDCGSDIYTDTIMVQPSPIIAQMSFSAEQVCVGDSLMLINISSPGTIPNWTVTLSDGDVFFFLGDTIFVEPDTAGLFTVVLYANGCGFDSISLEFEALPLPDISVAHDPGLSCEGDVIHFEVTSTGNGLILFYGDGDSTDLHFSDHAYSAGGTYLLSATVQSPFGCESEWSEAITIEERPTDLAMIYTDEICANTPTQFIGQGIGVQSWEWIFCDTCFRAGATVSYSFDTFGLHTVQLVGVSPLGCRDTIDGPFFVNTTPTAIIDYEIIDDCSPAEVFFNSLSLDFTGVVWQTGGAPLSMDNSTTIITETLGLLEVQLIATNGEICYDTAYASIPILESPTFEVFKNANCTNIEGTAISVETDQNNSVSIFGTSYNASGNFHQNVPSGDYLIEVISDNGCVAEEEIVVIPVPELFIQLEQKFFDIDLGEQVQLNVLSNLTAVTYSWSPAVDLDNASIANPVTRPLISTFYAVAVTDSRECIKYDTAFVHVNIDREDQIFIPNTFTPNKDGANDIFRIRSLNPGMENIVSFEIFDRFGEKVYEGRNCQPETADCGWDGNFRGQKAEMGSYIWMAELEFLDGISVKRTGEVALLR